MYKENLIPLTDRPGWNSALTGIPHSFAHTWESCWAMFLTHGYPTYLYEYSDEEVRIVCPICEREYQGYKDITTPFGVPGFAGTGPCPEFPERWQRFASSQKYVCGYIGMNPVLGDESHYHSSDAYPYNRIFVQDLKPSVDEIFAGFSSSRKLQLKKNWEIYSQKITLNKKRLTDFFLANYHDFMRRREASPIYNFKMETLAALTEARDLLMVGIEDNGMIVAVILYPYTAHLADYLFNINLDEGRPYSACLIWYAIQALKARGIPYLNYGGGRYEDDPKNEFKKRFNPKSYPLTALKQVYDAGIYLDLCRQVQADAGDRSGFFPPYHKP